MLRLLVLDAYAREGRKELDRVLATRAGELYRRMLLRLAPEATVDVVHPADPDGDVPSGAALADYDGAAWTGSSLTILEGDDPRVRRQVELVRALRERGVPGFGSCWAAQLLAVAGGGRCRANPNGREFGLARKIALTDEGRAHPLYAGKPAVFDAFTSHGDEVEGLPRGGSLLASNDFTRVQALALDERTPFWAVQYHPEYDLHEVARLCVARCDVLVEQGSFRDRAAAHAWIADLEALHRDPARADLRFVLGIDPDVLDPDRRQVEVRNWLDRVVRPRAGR